MRTQAPTPPAISRTTITLADVLRVDGAAGMVSGLGLLTLAAALPEWVGLPTVVARVGGVVLLGWGAWLVRTSTRTVSRRTLTAVLALDAVWILASVAVATASALTPLGVGLVLGQAALVGGVTVAEVGTYRTGRL